MMQALTLKWDQVVKRLFLCVLLAIVSIPASAAPWLSFGPDGGDARSFGADPRDHAHLYLGTASGWIYESRDGAQHWHRLARVGNRDDLVIDNILVDRDDSKHLLVGGWVLGRPDGGLYVSRDGGLTWKINADMKGQSVLALSAAPSDPKTFVAGTLQGVYRSTDIGEHWALISPAASKELHEVESTAIDPVDPNVIYAGTWHLPWKTEDGGANWKSIKEGLIDDSDVFSIIVDPKDAKVVYASACSGIYKSEDAGDKFVKVQGIPSTARRTRVLLADPQDPNVVLAGTTEGLFRTVDAGKTWSRTTGPEVIVNDLYIDPTNRLSLLVATDRGGVLASLDGGATFQPSNSGFSARQVAGYVEDARKPGTIYIGVLNDKQWGGVFVSANGGLTWEQQSAGLDGHDVFSLGQTSDGSLLAGTGHGIYRWQEQSWIRVNDISTTSALPSATKDQKAVKTPALRTGPRSSGGKTPFRRSSAARTPAKKPAATGFDGAIFALARIGDQTFAATSSGVLRSSTAGESWTQVAGVDPHSEWHYLSAAKDAVLVANLTSALRSLDGGNTWVPVHLPTEVTQITAAAVDGFGGIWIGGREGVFVSTDAGSTWETLKTLYIRDVNSIFYDQAGERVLIAANESGRIAFGVHLPDRRTSFWDTGWYMRFIRPVGDHLVGATLFDGMVVQPRMVASPEGK